MHVSLSRPKVLLRFSLTSFAASFVFLMGLALTPVKSYAIPKDEAIKKFNVVALFFLTDKSGKPITINSDSNEIQFFYLNHSKAVLEKDQLERSGTLGKGLKVSATTLNTLLKRYQYLTENAYPGDKQYLVSILPDAKDRELAIQTLVNEGGDRPEIESTLSTPVFYTDPYLQILMGSGVKQNLLFFSYSDLKASLRKLPDSERQAFKLKVADFNNVFSSILSNEDDVFAVSPTSDYQKIIRGLRQRGDF